MQFSTKNTSKFSKVHRNIFSSLIIMKRREEKNMAGFLTSMERC